MTEAEYPGPDSRRVQEMFAGIAHRYDFLNHFLSASIDRRWRRLAVRKAAELAGSTPLRLCLDVCSGTGDLAIGLRRRFACTVIASDFCHAMLRLASKKFPGSPIHNVGADALALPFADRSFDAVTIAFGLRNLQDPVRGLLEMRRVLRPGGAFVILEFSQPVVPVVKEIFDFYFTRILPKVGAAISGDAAAYEYLPDSVRKFPAQRELLRLIEAAGFKDAGYGNLSGGIAALHWARK
jgi:demethylmenaquinone methyltransferase/2-methoxy-6-polyprenyl-1,4-benzoquinol methylase